MMKNISVTERNKLLLHATTCRDLKGITLNEKSQSQKVTSLYESIYITFSKGQNNRDGEQTNGCQGLGMVCVYGRRLKRDYARKIFVVLE